MRRRLALLPLTVLGVLVLVSVFLHLVPGDAVDVMLGESAAPADREALRRALGLDRPWPAQLLRFVAALSQGDLGWSLSYRTPVAKLVAARWPATLELALAALAFALVVALPLGIAAGARPGSAIDHLARWTSLTGVCVPTIVLGPLLILGFAVHLGWLPVSGREGPAHLALPATTLGLGMVGILVRLARTAMIAALAEPWAHAARARGASPLRVVLRHALPAALPPLVTVAGLQAGALLAGAIVTETIFAWPGIGRLTVQAIGARDYPLVQGCVLVIAVTYVIVNCCTDVVLLWLDPRLRDGE